MIGKSLNERYGILRGVLPAQDAVKILHEVLASQAEHLVRVRDEDARMIACLIVRADESNVRLCKTLGFWMKPGGTGVFGLLGTEAVRTFPELSPPQRRWLETPCHARETKVLLLAASGLALLSLELTDGTLTITPFENASA